MKILLVEDNEEIIEGLKYALNNEGYEVICVKLIKNAFEELKKSHFDLLILDVFLPDGNGFDFYKSIKNKNISSIFLTAKDEEDDVVKGLELGAEDYITKPFSTKELLLRIKKILLRNEKNTIIRAKNVSFDIEKMICKKNECEIYLTAIEMNILMTLMLNKGFVVTRDKLIDKIWEITGNDVYDHTITVYIKRLKDKIDDDIIINQKGIGYKIND